MLKRVDSGDGRYFIRPAHSQRIGPIDHYQTKQAKIMQQAKERGELADRIRQNIELTLRLSDHALMRYNKDTFEFFETYNTTDPVLKKLVRMDELRRDRGYNWKRFNGDLSNYGGEINDTIRNLRREMEDRIMKEGTYKFLETTPMTKIFESWIEKARQEYDSRAS